MRTATRTFTLLAAVVLTGSMTACSGDAEAPGASSGTPSPAADNSTDTALTGTLTVYAAASLRDSFTTLAADFEKAHDGVTVRTEFAGSADLLTQLAGGAPADILATADTATMDKAVAADLIDGDPIDFATNTLVIAVEPGNPKNITALADLTSDDITLVVCAPQVPCGAATAKAADAADVTLKPVSETNSVTDVLQAVTSGEADAGLVYVTDVAGSDGAAEAVEFPESSQAVNTYPIATVAGTPNLDLAAAFIAYVNGPEGRKVLDAAGFGAA